MSYRRGRRNNEKPQQEENYLLGAFNMLLKECDRLQRRVRYLEDQLDQPHYELDTVEKNDYYDQFFKKDQPPKKKRVLEPEYKPEKPVEIKAVSRRNTSDLYREANKKHENEVAKQLAEQEKAAEKILDKHARLPESVLGKEKTRFYVEQAKAIVGDKK